MYKKGYYKPMLTLFAHTAGIAVKAVVPILISKLVNGKVVVEDDIKYKPKLVILPM